MRREKVLSVVNDGALIAVSFMQKGLKKFKRLEIDDEAFGLLVAAYDMEYVTGRIFNEKKFDYDVIRAVRAGLLEIIPKGFAKNSEYTQESIIDYFREFVHEAAEDLTIRSDTVKVKKPTAAEMLKNFNNNFKTEVVTNFSDYDPEDVIKAVDDRMMKLFQNERVMWKRIRVL